MVQKTKRLNPSAQIAAEIGVLKRIIPDGRLIKHSSQSFVWECNLQPTPLSKKYAIKVFYTFGSAPSVYVTDPKPLDIYPGKKDLPHVYSTKQQEICLYYPKIGEWNIDKLIAKTIIPWASEWLLYYELWLATGVWLGEGIHPSKKTRKCKSTQVSH